MTLCTEEASPYWNEGLEGWFHPLPGQSWDADAPREVVRKERPKRPERKARAGIAKRNAVYKAMLSSQALFDSHREHLQGPKRQMTAEQIQARGYKSIYVDTDKGRGQEDAAFHLAEVLQSEFGDIDNVPGFGFRQRFSNKQGDQVAGAITLAPRILIPIRSTEGLIQGFQTLDPSPDCHKKRRYQWFSGVGETGASIGTPLHVSRPTEGDVRPEVIVTEGPLKADIVSNRTGCVVVAFQGVRCIDWDALYGTISQLNPTKLLLAIDMDRKATDEPANKSVAQAHEDLCDWCEREGFEYLVGEWDYRQGKGLDDLLLGGSKATWRPRRAPEPDLQPDEVHDSRLFTERAYICAAWSHEQTARVLASFKLDRWADEGCKAAAKAIGAILKREETLDPVAVGSEMKLAGQYSQWLKLAEFGEEHKSITESRASLYKEFKRAIFWDDIHAIMDEFKGRAEKEEPKTFLIDFIDKLSDLMKAADPDEVKNLKQVMEAFIESSSNDKEEKTKPVNLKFFHRVIGPARGGYFIPVCGPPKIGKSGVMDELIEECAKNNDVCLLGQLELDEEQICERKASTLLQKPYRKTSLQERYSLLSNGRINHLENILLTTEATSLEEYKRRVYSILSKHPEVRVWATDYSEMLQSFEPGVDQLTQTEAVSDFCKKTAKAFGVVSILLTQPNQKYYLECKTDNRPKLHHWKRGSKYQQDGHSLIFLHSPSKFDPELPSNYLEAHVQLSRSSGTGVIPLHVDPATYSYSFWKGPVPMSGRLADQVEAQKNADDILPPAEEIPLLG